ncbi:hypothetical protein EGJ53_16920 [Pseudomonas fluorescens]|nr:hypothetical protein EGJ53_16920 [Pseudomonas fluorescens]
MRYIDTAFLEVPPGWEQRSRAAALKLLAGTHTADELSAVWGDLKQCLSEASNRRCWYCETSIIRSDNAVDHYRPKGTLKGAALSPDGESIVAANIFPVHSGYKWCAFSLENFRYSCDHCNEYRKNLEGTAGGKSSYFPLVEEGLRAYDENAQEFENPAILDPCNVLDWRLLSYDLRGKPFSRFVRGSAEDVKVRYSIRLLHLDQEGLNEGRRANWMLVNPILSSAKTWYLKMLRNVPGAHSHFQTELKKLRQWLNPKTQSAFIGFLVYKLENDSDLNVHPWIDKLVRAI